MRFLLDPQFKDLTFVTEEERKKTHKHMLDAMEGITLESLDGTAAENTSTMPEDEPPRKKPKIDLFDFKIEDDGSDAEEDRSTLKTKIT